MIYYRGGFGKSCGEEAVLKIFNHTLIGRKDFRVGEIPHHIVFGHVNTLNSGIPHWERI